jgi:hypothetical protein
MLYDRAAVGGNSGCGERERDARPDEKLITLGAGELRMRGIRVEVSK